MSRKRTKEQFVALANKKHKNTFVYDKVEYIHSWIKVTITCLLHGDWDQYPGSHLAGHGCSGCKSVTLGNLYRKDFSQFVEEANKKFKYKYDYSESVYISGKKKIKIICPIHGPFFSSPENHLKKITPGCVECSDNVSRGETLVKTIMDNNKIDYIQQKTFIGVKGKRKHLQYDFWLPRHNMLIEYDGIQHSRPSFSSNEETSNQCLRDLQKCDKIKNKYAASAGITLIRIPHTVKTVDDIVAFVNPYFQQALV